MLYYLLTKVKKAGVDCAIADDLDTTIKLRAKGWNMIGFMNCRKENIMKCARGVLQDYYTMNYEEEK
jgi:hypothetical protein